jgi:hypothetical protein
MEKQEVIKKAYGDRWEFLKDNVDENGWFPDSILGDSIWVLSECERTFINDQLHWRMSSLKGLEDNNGWIKIEREEDLPKNSCSCWIEVKYQYTNTPFWYDCTKKCFSFKGIILQANEVTHYIPVEQPKQRIY